MIKGTHTTGAPSRADHLRELAGQAENLAALAVLADAQLTRATNLNCDADTLEVGAAIGGGK